MLALTLSGLTMTGCTYTQVASSPPVYVEPEPEPYYEEPYYDGPFDELSPYGTWIETAPFGWVWQPYGSYGWQPYYQGNWARTRWGWTWVSYEPFGWATYHYGFWHYEPVYGWIWVPGDQWSPARVSWMYYGDYILWSPIPPPGYYIADPWDVHSDFIWVGVHVDHFTQNEIGRYKVRSPRHVWGGVPRVKIRREAPAVEYIEVRTKVKVRTVDVGMKKFTKGGKEYERMVLPPAERETIERYEKRDKDENDTPQPRPETEKSATKKPATTRKKEAEAKKPDSKESEPVSKKEKDAGSDEKSKEKKGDKTDDKKDDKERKERSKG